MLERRLADGSDVGAEDVMQAFSYRHVVPTKEFVVAVLETSLFSLATNVPRQEGLQVKQGAQAQIVVKAVRGEGAKFPINLAVVDSPAGMTAQTVPIPADQDEVSVTLSVSAQAPAGTKVNVILSGTMTAEKETATRIAPAVSVTILPAG